MTTPRLANWEEVSGFALGLPDTILASHYGRPSIKVQSNGRAFVTQGREPDSFVLMIDEDSKLMLIDTDPATFWQTPHYEGWPALLVRYGGNDPDRVASVIARAHSAAAAMAPVKARKPR